MFIAILWIARSGAAWRDTGLLESLFIALNNESGYENLSIDSTVVTAHQQSASVKKRGLISVVSQRIGKSSDGHTTKIHVIVDGLGNLLYFKLSGGNLHNSVLAIEVLDHVAIQGSNIIGVRAYGWLAIRTYVSNHDATYPPTK